MRDLLLLGLLIIAVPLILRRPWIGVLVFTAMAVTPPHSLVWGFMKSMPLSLIVALATLIGTAVTKDRRPIAWDRETILIVGLLFFFALTSVFAWVPESAWAKWIELSKVILMCMVATMLIHGQQRIRWFLIVCAMSVGYYGLKGGPWSLATGGEWTVLGPEAGNLGGNTFIGLAMTMVVPLLFALGQSEPKRWLRWLFHASGFFSIIATIFTYSRGALIGLLVVLVLLFIASATKRVLLLMIAIPMVIFGKDFIPDRWYAKTESGIINYEQDQSATQRLNAWTIHFNAARESPLVGAGFNFNEYPDYRRFYDLGNPAWRGVMAEDAGVAAHSIYFQVLGHHGFIGFGLFCLMLSGAYFKLGGIARTAKGSPDAEALSRYARAIQIGLAGYLVSGAFLSVAYLDVMFNFIAASSILAREHRKLSASETGPAKGFRIGTRSVAAPAHFVRTERIG